MQPHRVEDVYEWGAREHERHHVSRQAAGTKGENDAHRADREQRAQQPKVPTVYRSDQWGVRESVVEVGTRRPQQPYNLRLPAEHCRPERRPENVRLRRGRIRIGAIIQQALDCRDIPFARRLDQLADARVLPGALLLPLVFFEYGIYLFRIHKYTDHEP